MHTLIPERLRELEERFGRPRELQLRWPVRPQEVTMIETSRRGWRSHDVTLFIFGPDGRLALIRKRFYPPGAWRPPSGGVNPGEAFVDGLVREAREETGLVVVPTAYVLRVRVTFVAGENPAAEAPWVTHVFTASTEMADLAPQDTDEIAGARWGTADELAGPIRSALLGAGLPLLAYRAWLHDRVLEVLPSR